MGLDSTSIAVDGVGFGSLLMAMSGLGEFNVFEFEEVSSADFRLFSNRRSRGSSSKWKPKRQVVVSARLNQKWLDESTMKAALVEQLIDDDEPPIRVIGSRITFKEQEPVTVSVSEFRVNSVPYIKPRR